MGEETLLNHSLTCHDLRFSYGSKVILDGIDLIVGESETLAIFGRSGAGKSTLLKVINLLETPSSGDGFLRGQKYMSAGRPLYALNEIRAQMPLVFQHFNLFPNLTALTNITLPARRVKNIPKAEAEETAYFLAEQLEIKDVLLQYPGELSGGQAQRVAIARSLALQPPVLLLDEVTSALDPETVVRLTKTIKDIRTLNVGKILSIVIVTHIINFAVDFADRIVFLHEGKFIEDEKASDFVTNVRHPAAREFVSTFSS